MVGENIPSEYNIDTRPLNTEQDPLKTPVMSFKGKINSSSVIGSSSIISQLADNLKQFRKSEIFELNDQIPSPNKTA